MFEWLRRWFWGLSARLNAFFDSTGGQLVIDAVEGALKTAGSAALTMILTEAQKQVRAIESRDLSGRDKAASVEEQLTAFAITLGLNVSRSLILWAIETSVQAMRKEPTTVVILPPVE